MMMNGTWKTIRKTDGRELPFFHALPSGKKPRAHVLLLQEVFGVNHHLIRLALRLADEGYAVSLPDLFFRQGAGHVTRYDNVAEGVARMQGLQEADFLSDIDALLEKNKLPSFALGFCMGGRLSFTLACERKLHGAVSFYGGSIARGPLARSSKVACPMLLLYGGKDTHIPLTEVDQVRSTLRDHGKEVEVVVYPDAGHGFFCEDRGSYEDSAAQDAWKKVTGFIEAALN